MRLPGDLVVPEGAVGVVAFAHGSGSSRRSPRNVWVARRLNAAGVATLLFDLLTPDEAEDRANVFDIALLAARLIGAERWLRDQPELTARPVGFFGASTGAAAALVAAADLGDEVAAVVSRGGRPDLAGDALPRVSAPTLLIVGGADTQVLLLNREAERRMRCERRLEVVPGATHLFEEPGALEAVADLASGWFTRHLGAGGGSWPGRARRLG
jgi:putative phosphoribosyl transferase